MWSLKLRKGKKKRPFSVTIYSNEKLLMYHSINNGEFPLMLDVVYVHTTAHNTDVWREIYLALQMYLYIFKQCKSCGRIVCISVHQAAVQD